MERAPQNVADKFPGRQVADGGEIGAEQLLHAEGFQHPVFGVGEISSQAASLGRAQGGCSKVKTAETVPSTPTARVMTARWPMCTPSKIPRATARGISGIFPPGNAIVFMGSHAFRCRKKIGERRVCSKEL